MSRTLTQPARVYRRGTVARITEGLRYGGGIGQWSWLLHRLTGVGILIFLIIHVIDTFLVVAFPAEYDWTVSIYGGTFSGQYYWPLRWGFRIAELGLIASVLFHSVNGVRVILWDFWPRAAQYQRAIFWGVLVLFFGIMIPVTYWVLSALLQAPPHMVA